jgi:DnaK suppressor protein
MQQDISQTADTLLKEGGKLANNSPDTADLASELSEQDVAVSLLDSAWGTFDQIEVALERIDQGSYGFCEDCGEEIPAERLDALPYAAHCVRCAARREAEAVR